MKYIVSAENTPYFYWQLELLIESFKMKGLEKDLVIAIAVIEENSKSMPKNMEKIKIISHENIGRKMGYVPINKPMAVHTALVSKTIDFPFTLIDPDMILNNPVDIESNAQVVSQECYEMHFEHMNHQKCFVEHHLRSMGKIDQWLPLGIVYVFNHIDPKVFLKVIEWCSKLAEEQNSKGSFWWPTEMAAWNLALLECGVSREVNYNLEQSLHEGGYANFIHYQLGFPCGIGSFPKYWDYPLCFAKEKYKEIEEDHITYEPYKNLLRLEPEISNSVVEIQKVVKSYIEFTS